MTSWSPFAAEILMPSAWAARANSALGFSKLIAAISALETPQNHGKLSQKNKSVRSENVPEQNVRRLLENC